MCVGGVEQVAVEGGAQWVAPRPTLPTNTHPSKPLNSNTHLQRVHPLEAAVPRGPPADVVREHMAPLDNQQLLRRVVIGQVLDVLVGQLRTQLLKVYMRGAHWFG